MLTRVLLGGLGAVLLYFLISRRRSHSSGSGTPRVPLPGSSADLGEFRTLPHRTPVTPVVTPLTAPPIPPSLDASGAPAGYTVTLTGTPNNKINAIKAVREVRRGLDLRASKDLIEALPQPQILFQGLSEAEALRVQQYLGSQGVAAAVS